MMTTQASFCTGLPIDIKTSSAISVLETPVSAPLSPIYEDKYFTLTVRVVEASSPQSLLPESKDPFLTHQISHEHDQRQPSLPILKPQSVVAVIGVGYVGTHLVEAFAHHYDIIAFDLSNKRLSEVASQLDDLPIEFISNASDIRRASHFLVSVPTLLNLDKTIDTTCLRSAISTVKQHVRPGSTIVIESFVAVGTTRALAGPLMLTKSFLVGCHPSA
ncbi:hypothetical protein B5807_11016 [Epicoccum nigrum]|uniref:UDP-glucose/GDP-mannose dehydrogenase N-terminal domain-containing protein n=1 Tax=Epicoccum nigrum TaxID=105696 RepID=A0A1Y2LL42_EPING|nr:hypothetical protein B5807_11016 [Epicoccum nigrum]